jgi:hypothetical protein
MNQLSVSERLKIYTRYIGQKVVLSGHNVFSDTQIGELSGVNSSSIQVAIKGQSRWIPLYDDFDIYEIKLLLKPLRLLTDSIKETANSLPVQNFITQYYIQLGFDMPMFFAPGHPLNCKYVEELGLATYHFSEQVLETSHVSVNSVHRKSIF